ncbi:hypothetical protein OSTOST_13004, partial [Ostertagia ostertagi]
HHHQDARNRLQGDVRLALVVGGDVVESFTRILPNGENLWHPNDVRDIITKFGLIVIRREGADPVRTLQSMSCLQDIVDQVLILADDGTMEEARGNGANHSDPVTISVQLPPSAIPTSQSDGISK